MEVKVWEYDEYPGLTEEVEGAVHIPTTGDEPGVYHWHDIPYAEVDGHTLVLQILEPYTRNEPEKLHPCFVFVQGSAWGVQDVYKSCPHYARLGCSIVIPELPIFRHRFRMPEMQSGLCACMRQITIWTGKTFSWAAVPQAAIPPCLQLWRIRNPGWMPPYIREYLQMSWESWITTVR